MHLNDRFRLRPAVMSHLARHETVRACNRNPDGLRAEHVPGGRQILREYPELAGTRSLALGVKVDASWTALSMTPFSPHSAKFVECIYAAHLERLGVKVEGRRQQHVVRDGGGACTNARLRVNVTTAGRLRTRLRPSRPKVLDRASDKGFVH